MSMKTHHMPTFLQEFRSKKLEMIISDLHKLSPDELVRIKREINQLLQIDSDH